MSACPQKTPNLPCDFRKRRPTNTPRCHLLADDRLSSFDAPLPSFSLFGAASVMCCFARPASWSAPLRPCALREDRIGRKFSRLRSLESHRRKLFLCPKSGHEKQHEHVILELKVELRYLELKLCAPPQICLHHWSEVWPLWDGFAIAQDGDLFFFLAIQLLLRPGRVDSQTVSSSFMCGMSCCGHGTLVAP